MSANLMSLARSGGKFLKLFGDRKMMKLLPYDAEGEWIDFNGGAGVDTGIVPTLTTITSINCCFTDDSGVVSTIFAADNLGYVLRRSNKNSLQYSGGEWWVDANVDFTVFANYSIRQDGAYKDGLKIIDRALSKNQTQSLTIGFRRSQPSQVGGLRVKAFSMSDNNETLRDYTPVRVGSVGYFYDKVSKQLFGNSFAGELVIGPDKTT